MSTPPSTPPPISEIDTFRTFAPIVCFAYILESSEAVRSFLWGEVPIPHHRLTPLDTPLTERAMTAQRFQQALAQANPQQKKRLLAFQEQLHKMIEKFEQLGVDPALFDGHDHRQARNDLEEIAQDAVAAFWKRKDLLATLHEILGKEASSG